MSRSWIRRMEAPHAKRLGSCAPACPTFRTSETRQSTALSARWTRETAHRRLRSRYGLGPERSSGRTIASSLSRSCVMRHAPSIVPLDRLDRDIYLVLEDFGARAGCSWRETDEQDTDRETVLRDLLSGQYA